MKATKMKKGKMKKPEQKTLPANPGSFQRKLEKQVLKLSGKVERLKQALKSERRVSNDRLMLLQGRFFGGAK